MASRKLKKRNYLGVGYVHVFINDTTGETLIVPCTEKEYTRMSEKDGQKYNPVREGYRHDHSLGGTFKVDTPSSMLGDDEYCEADGEKIVNLKGAEWNEKHQKLKLDAIDSNDNLDESKLKVKLKVK